jgi:putative toxin-antitoxin system antitoxin component (TIGR02293 family)
MPLPLWHNVSMASAAKPVFSTPLLTTLHLNLASVESGVPVATMSDFVATSGLPLKDIYEVVIPARTLKHRRARKESLSTDESDKLARLVRVFDHTVAVFEYPDLARTWLNKPKKRFDGRTPMDMLRTEVGARMVEEMLGQIDEGMFA